MEDSKPVQRGKFIATNSYLKKKENYKWKNLILHLKGLEKEQTKPTCSKK